MPTNVIIDTDCGHDDLFAILILLHHHLLGKIRIRAITSVVGLLSAHHGADVVRKLLEIIDVAYNSDSSDKTNRIKVLVGSETPFEHESLKAAHSFKEADWYATYEDSLLRAGQILLEAEELEAQIKHDLATSTTTIAENHSAETTTEAETSRTSSPGDDANNPAVEYLLEYVHQQDEKTVLICLGPLTNIARCIKRCPDFLHRFERVVLMGGNFRETPGNTPNLISEWNIYADSLAANYFIQSITHAGKNANVVFIGLEVANEDVVPLEQQNMLKNLDTNKVKDDFFTREEQLHKQLIRVSELIKRAFLLSDFACSYDPVAVTYVLREDLFQLEPLPITGIDTKPPYEGKILIAAGAESNTDKTFPIQIAVGLKQKEYIDFLKDIITLESVVKKEQTKQQQQQQQQQQQNEGEVEDDSWLYVNTDNNNNNNANLDVENTLEGHLKRNQPSLTEKLNQSLLRSFRDHLGKFSFERPPWEEQGYDDDEEDAEEYFKDYDPKANREFLRNFMSAFRGGGGNGDGDAYGEEAEEAQ